MMISLLKKHPSLAWLWGSGSPYLHGALQIRGNWLGCLEEETPENLGTLGSPEIGEKTWRKGQKLVSYEVNSHDVDM